MPNAWKLETMTHKPSLKGCSLNRDFTSTFILFYLNLTIWFSCLKTWGIVSWVHMFGGFFNFKKKREINDKGDICVERDVHDDNGIMDG